MSFKNIVPKVFLFFHFGSFSFRILFFNPKLYFIYISVLKLERGKRKSLKNNEGEKVVGWPKFNKKWIKEFSI